VGCFSFLCRKCDKPINSDSFSGQHCVLTLLDKGELVEQMQGQYDSYGRVFKSIPEGAWGDDSEITQFWETMEWGDVCTLIFNSDETSGITAHHLKCYDPYQYPTHKSDNDPNQGWGYYKAPKTLKFSHRIFRNVSAQPKRIT